MGWELDRRTAGRLHVRVRKGDWDGWRSMRQGRVESVCVGWHFTNIQQRAGAEWYDGRS